MPLKTPKTVLVQLNAVGTGGHAPADSTTYYFGAYTGFNPAGLPITASIQMPGPGRVRRARLRFSVYGTLASAGSVSVSVRNDTAGTTEVITSALALTGVNNVDGNDAMSLAFDTGDVLAIQFTTPAWATNPTAVVYNVTLEVELL